MFGHGKPGPVQTPWFSDLQRQVIAAIEQYVAAAPTTRTSSFLPIRRVAIKGRRGKHVVWDVSPGHIVHPTRYAITSDREIVSAKHRHALVFPWAFRRYQVVPFDKLPDQLCRQLLSKLRVRPGRDA